MLCLRTCGPGTEAGANVLSDVGSSTRASFHQRGSGPTLPFLPVPAGPWPCCTLPAAVAGCRCPLPPRCPSLHVRAAPAAAGLLAAGDRVRPDALLQGALFNKKEREEAGASELPLQVRPAA